MIPKRSDSQNFMKFENIACLLDEMDFIFPSLFDSRECSIRPGIDFSSSILS